MQAADATEEVDEDSEDQSFAAESDLRDFLAKNLSCIEQGLKVFQDGQQSGVEYPIDNGLGWIDILAIDSEDRPVVIELKLSRGRNRTIGQLLYYMGWMESRSTRHSASRFDSFQALSRPRSGSTRIPPCQKKISKPPKVRNDVPIRTPTFRRQTMVPRSRLPGM